MESLKILVTGGAGFIEYHLVRALVMAGHSVRVLYNQSTASLDNLRIVIYSIEFVEDDVRDYKTVVGLGMLMP